MHVRRRLVVAFLIAGAIVFTPLDPAIGLSVSSGLVILLVLSDVVRAPRASALRPRRTVPAVLRMGRPADVVVDLHNPTGRKLLVEVHDATPPSMGRVPLRHRVTIEPRGWAELTAEITPTRRGRASLGPLTKIGRASCRERV